MHVIQKILVEEHIMNKYDLESQASRSGRHAHSQFSNYPQYDREERKTIMGMAEIMLDLCLHPNRFLYNMSGGFAGTEYF
jgi:hypothetical protein